MKETLDRLRAKLQEPMTHFFLSAALLAISMKVPPQYDLYFYIVCGVLAGLGFVLPGPLRKQVGALLVAHQEVTGLVLPIAKEAGLDTSGLDEAAAHAALPLPKPAQEVLPSSNVPGKPWLAKRP